MIAASCERRVITAMESQPVATVQPAPVAVYPGAGPVIVEEPWGPPGYYYYRRPYYYHPEPSVNWGFSVRGR